MFIHFRWREILLVDSICALRNSIAVIKLRVRKMRQPLRNINAIKWLWKVCRVNEKFGKEIISTSGNGVKDEIFEMDKGLKVLQILTKFFKTKKKSWYGEKHSIRMHRSEMRVESRQCLPLCCSRANHFEHIPDNYRLRVSARLQHTRTLPRSCNALQCPALFCNLTQSIVLQCQHH